MENEVTTVTTTAPADQVVYMDMSTGKIYVETAWKHSLMKLLGAIGIKSAGRTSTWIYTTPWSGHTTGQWTVSIGKNTISVPPKPKPAPKPKRTKPRVNKENPLKESWSRTSKLHSKKTDR